MSCFPSRSSLQDQNTKVAVVLIQKNAPLPPGKTLIMLDLPNIALQLTNKLIILYAKSRYFHSFSFSRKGDRFVCLLWLSSFTKLPNPLLPKSDL